MDETKQKVSKQFIDFLTTFRNREEINLFTIDEVITSQKKTNEYSSEFFF